MMINIIKSMSWVTDIVNKEHEIFDLSSKMEYFVQQL